MRKKFMRLGAFFLGGLFAGELFFSGSVMAAPIDTAKSSVVIVFSQMGVPVEAQFKRFSGDVHFDATAPANTRAVLTVDVASFDLGDAEYNKEVLKPEWFNAAKFTQATFTSSAVRVLSADKLEADGQLTIKGRAQKVVVPISVKKDGKQQTFSGELIIKRLAFAVGEGEWSATDMVEDNVKIRFTVVTAAQ